MKGVCEKTEDDKQSIMLERVVKLESTIEAQAAEIVSLRNSRHDHAGKLQAHNAILDGLKDSIQKLTDAVSNQIRNTDENTQKIREALVSLKVFMIVTGMTVTIVLYAAEKIFKVW